MRFWMILWQAVFVVGVSAFALISVWVIVGGFNDVRRLFDRLRGDSEDAAGPH